MIKELIYNYFDDKRIEKESKERSISNINFAPSYLDKCKRQIYYTKKNVPASNPIETHSYIKFEMGDSVHLSIQNILKEIGIYIEGEDFKNANWNDLNWIYRIDGKLNINNEDYLIEIKSVYSSGYNAIEKEAKPDHELQLLLYMIFENVDKGILFYIGRDNGYIVEYNYIFDALYSKYELFLEKKIAELKRLKKDIENDIIPNRDNQIILKNNNGIISDSFQKDNEKYKSDWQCSYCSWRNLCWEDVFEKIQNHKFYIDNEYID